MTTLKLARGMLFTRSVTTSVKPSSMKAGSSYMLNGQTHAIFLGKDMSYEYQFRVIGRNDPGNPADIEILSYFEVLKYISPFLEVDPIHDPTDFVW